MDTLIPKNSVRGDFFTFWAILAHSAPGLDFDSQSRPRTKHVTEEKKEEKKLKIIVGFFFLYNLYFFLIVLTIR